MSKSVLIAFKAPQSLVDAAKANHPTEDPTPTEIGRYALAQLAACGEPERWAAHRPGGRRSWDGLEQAA